MCIWGRKARASHSQAQDIPGQSTNCGQSQGWTCVTVFGGCFIVPHPQRWESCSWLVIHFSFDFAWILPFNRHWLPLLVAKIPEKPFDYNESLTGRIKSSSTLRDQLPVYLHQLWRYSRGIKSPSLIYPTPRDRNIATGPIPRHWFQARRLLPTSSSSSLSDPTPSLVITLDSELVVPVLIAILDLVIGLDPKYGIIATVPLTYFPSSLVHETPSLFDPAYSDLQ